MEGRYFSQSVKKRWHILENDPLLHNIWPNYLFTAYRKTESLKDNLVHFHQAKPFFLRSTPNDRRKDINPTRKSCTE